MLIDLPKRKEITRITPYNRSVLIIRSFPQWLVKKPLRKDAVRTREYVYAPEATGSVANIQESVCTNIMFPGRSYFRNFYVFVELLVPTGRSCIISRRDLNNRPSLVKLFVHS